MSVSINHDPVTQDLQQRLLRAVSCVNSFLLLNFTHQPYSCAEGSR